jgi:hypothetical protein
MLSKLTQRNLALYFSAMIVLHGYVLWQAKQLVPEGLPDFSIFYTAGHILRDGQGARLYDDRLQESVQRSFSPRALEKRGSILPYNHPPFEAVLFVPLARFSYLTAFWIWLGVNLGLLFSALLILRQSLGALGRAPLYLWILGCLAFFPIFMALIRGQDSILLLFLYCLAFVGLNRNAELSTGGWLGLGLYKYHLVLPFVFSLFRRKRVIVGFLAVAALLGLISVAVTGWHGLLTYPRYVWETDHDMKYVWNTTLGNTANLHGLIWTLVSESHPWLRTGLLVFSSAIVLMVMVYAWRRAFVANSECRQPLVALSLVGTVLLSYHIYVHDLSMLFLAIVLVLEVLLSDPPIPNGMKTTLYACMAILFCSPVYIVLALRYSQLQFMAVVLLIFFAGLLSLISALRAENDAAVRLRASAGR